MADYFAVGFLNLAELAATMVAEGFLCSYWKLRLFWKICKTNIENSIIFKLILRNNNKQFRKVVTVKTINYILAIEITQIIFWFNRSYLVMYKVIFF